MYADPLWFLLLATSAALRYHTLNTRELNRLYLKQLCESRSNILQI